MSFPPQNPTFRTGSVASVSSNATVVPAPKKQKPYYYHQLFNKVLRQRLRYFDRVSVVLALVVSLLLNLPTGGFWSYLLLVPVKTAALWLGFHLIKSSREIHVRVDYMPYKTLAGRLSGELLNWNFVSVIIGFAISSCIYYLFVYLSFDSFPLAIETKTRGKALVNDELVYYMFFVGFSSVVYSARHVALDLNRLRFKYAVARVNPQSVYMDQWGKFLRNAVVISTVTTFMAPVVYFFTRFLIYRTSLVPLLVLGYSTAIPPFKISFGLFTRLFANSVILTFCWELLNHFFNVYAQVGCLDGKKPLSTFSNDPINTLLTGLRDKNALVRLTAFQELAFLATAEDRKLREPFYIAHNKSNYVWLAILQECSAVVKETCKSITSRPKVPEIQTTDTFEKTSPASIFGNAKPASTNSVLDSLNVDLRSRSVTPPTANRDFYVRQPTKTRSEQLKESLQRIKEEDLSPAQSFLKSAYTQAQALYTTYYKNFLHTAVGYPFRQTVTLDVESRVVNATNFGNALIAMSYLTWNALDEDSQGIVSGSLTDVLVLLEKAISACAEYVDHPPKNLYKPLSGDVQATGMAVLHDLAMECFFQLTVKYNEYLNDLLLPPDVFRLAKLTIDNAIADQQQQMREKAAAGDLTMEI
ncbi:hypothetical protein BABINDRAFT_160141 [Babjeviella inositovora NRRL Y-12698]|uniref:Nucleoporin NDC1 n=1 Tax=Babjeviella inositovora NRRL Y-12698 TaxID=984486 RepID=A0A1E3QXW1_9ASCO|nr:uncharacterized protein BABINDRAFT_160141 [Babjeviella inositovora NRRL Y-12698]ODQ81912.1 hypothetical protein BABINDRAFT_160141 [Babjeviella inositovora NRRL Y-12698]